MKELTKVVTPVDEERAMEVFDYRNQSGPLGSNFIKYVIARGKYAVFQKIKCDEYLLTSPAEYQALEVYSALLTDFDFLETPKDDYQRLLDLLGQAQTSCANETDQPLQQLISHIISDAKEDLNAYAVSGGICFKRAAERITGKIAINADLLKKHNDKPVVKILHSFALLVFELAERCTVQFLEGISYEAGRLLLLHIVH